MRRFTTLLALAAGLSAGCGDNIHATTPVPDCDPQEDISALCESFLCGVPDAELHSLCMADIAITATPEERCWTLLEWADGCQEVPYEFPTYCDEVFGE